MNFVEKVKKLQNYFADGNFKRVIEGCEILNKKFPDNSFILNLSGMAYQRLNRDQRAINFFELALKADNNNISAMNNLANSLKNTEQYFKAEQVYKKIIKLNPSYINVYNNYGNLKSSINDIEKAINLYNQGINIAKEKNINSLVFLNHLAVAFQSLNKLTETIETVNKILKIDPNNVNAHQILSSIKKYSLTNEETMNHISQMKKILSEENFGDDQKGIISFALGKAYDDLKDSDEAIKFLSIGNKMMHKIRNSNIAEEINTINDMKNAFENIDLSIKHKSFSNKKIIFICGMPRSGTTLVEQIISSHKKVYGAGELPFLSSVVHNNFFNDSKLDKRKIAELQNSSKNLVNDQYFENISLFNFDENVLTDKAPLNFKWIGFIKIFFPNCKIIHCKRDPKDNCLSIYKNNFSSPKMNWAFNQKDISNYHNNYSSLMKFWYSKIPEFIHTIEYEKLVSDKKNEIEKLLEFCELELDDNCFNHHKNNKTPIKTVSISQAREPVYSSSVRSSDNYQDHLKEMFENLI
ncbi:Sulfotransferase domain family protein [Candidatus Pelagibacter sp. HTCC7211]|uniref:tetratricopeptide repeat-containing sulfotransferase family protein n=1 Tax=Pelagibacter sp. (strain HTCC7211) TaxID=439493 RepID=UPI00018393F3|nr:tetratricopeptide repeat-containing sulfotransferase family protein [Candidatus Pelagibacter sp. HTCC7211]EDZ60941.1 Sulfotransferase domain family protein [Candidatus Pelagibacter sp. HTCC7211]MBD1151448.1 sulfotransferase [Pelagibacterales bacterium SAG-MED25]